MVPKADPDTVAVRFVLSGAGWLLGLAVRFTERVTVIGEYRNRYSITQLNGAPTLGSKHQLGLHVNPPVNATGNVHDPPTACPQNRLVIVYPGTLVIESAPFPALTELKFAGFACVAGGQGV